MAEHVVLTGAGLVSPAGAGFAALDAALAEGRTCLGPLPPEVAGGLPLDFGGRVPAALEPPTPGERALAFARPALDEALAQAGPSLDPARTGLVLGSGLGTMERTEAALAAGALGDAATLAALHPHALTAALWGERGLGGPRRTFAVTCVSGLLALEQALCDLELGRADAVLVLGLETLSRTIQAGFCALEALSRTAGPELPSPTDGIVLGEAACALVLEREGAARARGARPLARLLGHALRADAVHLTSPALEGEGMRAAIGAALGGRAAESVAWVTLTAPGSPAYRELYARALAPAFGPDWRARATSWEDATGHLLGASGPVGIAHAARLLGARGGAAALVLTVGFGGLNGATLVGAADPS